MLYFVIAEHGDSKILTDRFAELPYEDQLDAEGKKKDREDWEKMDETAHLWSAFLLCKDQDAVENIMDAKVEYIE